MDQSSIGHIQVNIDPQNAAFYRDLFGFLGWSVLYEDANTVGVGGAQGSSLWFVGPAKDVKNDYDGPGMNHLGISVKAQADVDETVAYLQAHGVASLFETPRHRPDFSSGPDDTYYQVMFESPDRVLFEVVYTGPKSA
jgi:catechol 2,3-dioxygenase-like lactoylglutathione lyase family enzyme